MKIPRLFQSQIDAEQDVRITHLENEVVALRLQLKLMEKRLQSVKGEVARTRDTFTRKVK